MRQNPTDDELLRSYLLGELPEAEVDRLERRLLAEEELFELSEAVEADLLAACAGDELAPAERERVLRRLASSSQGRERLGLARSLNTLAGSGASTAAAPVVVPFARRAAAPSRPAVRWAALAAALLAAAGLSWFALERPHGGGSPPRVARERSAPASPHAPEAPPQAQGERPAPAPEPAKAVFQLALTSLRGPEAARQLRVPPGTGLVELQIGVEGMEDLGSFHLTVRNRKGEAILDQTGVEPRKLDGARVLVVDLPAGRLPAGTYEIQAQGRAPGSEPEDLSPLAFEVVRKGRG